MDARGTHRIRKEGNKETRGEPILRYSNPPALLDLDWTMWKFGGAAPTVTGGGGPAEIATPTRCAVLAGEGCR